MAKLTNRQLDVLAARVVDLLEEQHKIEADKIRESEEYKNFDKVYTDEYTEELAKIESDVQYFALLKRQVTDRIQKLRDKDVECLPSFNTWTLEQNTELVSNYLTNKKRKVFETSYFNREKTLRRVEADIILGDVSNPEELIKSLVEKLK